MQRFLPNFSFGVTVRKARSLAWLSCPEHWNTVDIRPMVEMKGLRSEVPGKKGRPPMDLSESFRSHLIYRCCRASARSDSGLVTTAAKVLGQDELTIERQLRDYRRGRHAPTVQKLKLLSSAFPAVSRITGWPWHQLIPRWLKEERTTPGRFGLGDEWSEGGVAPEMEPVGPDIFWACVGRFRQALATGNAREMLQGACETLYSVPQVLADPAIEGRSVEMVDLVYRLLSTMPPPLYPPNVDLKFLLASFLTDDELKTLPNPLLTRVDWVDDRFIRARYASTFRMTEPGRRQGNAAACRAWNFLRDIGDATRRTTELNAVTRMLAVYSGQHLAPLDG